MARVFIIVATVTTLVSSLFPTLHIPYWVFILLTIALGASYFVMEQRWEFATPLNLESMGVRNEAVIGRVLLFVDKVLKTSATLFAVLIPLVLLYLFGSEFGHFALLEMVVVQPFAVTLSFRVDVALAVYTLYIIGWCVYTSRIALRMEVALISKIEEETEKFGGSLK